MTDRLKPCPFCGGEAKIIETDVMHYQVFCEECKVKQFMFVHNSEEEAIKAWNTRKPMDRIIEELEIWAKSSERLYFEYNEEECYGAWRSYNKAIEIVKEGGK